MGVAGALLADPSAPPYRVMGAWLAPTLGWVASLYGGDYFDRDLDAIGKRQRPIPSGRMSPSEAFAGMMTAIVLGTVIAAALSPVNLVYVFLAGALGLSYSMALKARGIFGNIARGGPTALSLLLGATSAGDTVPVKLAPIALMFWLHDSSSNLVGTLCDRESDRRGGYRTFPVRHGDVATIWLVVLLDVCWMALALGIAVWWRPILGSAIDLGGYGAMVGSAALLAIISVRILIRADKPVPRLDCLKSHRVIVIERLLLPCALLAGGIGPAAAISFLVPSLAITLTAQKVMQGRYEPSRTARPEGVRS
ncbi:MAG TPA: UbiA family prenyltransferase [Streptosporangiaceae bacterium]|nr:UbiA family prenyltransferase [Streptosporangiaceae bacterium]